MTKSYDLTDDERGYNGWSNYETWAMALWIDNDQGSYNYAREMAKDAFLVGFVDAQRGEVGNLADALKDWQECSLAEWSPDSASVFTDLLGAAFGAIDWYEIASAILSEDDAS